MLYYLLVPFKKKLMQPWPECTCSSSTRFESMSRTGFIKWSTYSFTAKSMNFSSDFTVFRSCSVCLWMMFITSWAVMFLKQTPSSRSFFHLYFFSSSPAIVISTSFFLKPSRLSSSSSSSFYIFEKISHRTWERRERWVRALFCSCLWWLKCNKRRVIQG